MFSRTLPANPTMKAVSATRVSASSQLSGSPAIASMASIATASTTPIPIAAPNGNSIPPATATNIHSDVVEVPNTRKTGRVSSNNNPTTAARAATDACSNRPTRNT